MIDSFFAKLHAYSVHRLAETASQCPLDAQTRWEEDGGGGAFAVLLACDRARRVVDREWGRRDAGRGAGSKLASTAVWADLGSSPHHAPTHPTLGQLVTQVYSCHTA